MLTSEYSRKVIDLFRSGNATPQQEAEMVEALLSASERGLARVASINASIGFPAAQGVAV